MPEAPSRPALSTVAPIDGGHVGPASAVDVPPAPNAHVPARIQERESVPAVGFLRPPDRQGSSPPLPGTHGIISA